MPSAFLRLQFSRDTSIPRHGNYPYDSSWHRGDRPNDGSLNFAIFWIDWTAAVIVCSLTSKLFVTYFSAEKPQSCGQTISGDQLGFVKPILPCWYTGLVLVLVSSRKRLSLCRLQSPMCCFTSHTNSSTATVCDVKTWANATVTYLTIACGWCSEHCRQSTLKILLSPVSVQKIKFAEARVSNQSFSLRHYLNVGVMIARKLFAIKNRVAVCGVFHFFQVLTQSSINQLHNISGSRVAEKPYLNVLQASVALNDAFFFRPFSLHQAQYLSCVVVVCRPLTCAVRCFSFLVCSACSVKMHRL